MLAQQQGFFDSSPTAGRARQPLRAKQRVRPTRIRTSPQLNCRSPLHRASSPAVGRPASNPSTPSPAANTTEPDPASPNLYKVLGISQAATAANISKSFKSLARLYHPDKLVSNNIADDDGCAFKAITQAHRVLTNPSQRELYNRTGFKSKEDMAAGVGQDTSVLPVLIHQRHAWPMGTPMSPNRAPMIPTACFAPHNMHYSYYN